MFLMLRLLLLFWMAFLALAAPKFEVSFPAEARAEPADGRLIVVVSNKLEGEPRFQVSWNLSTQQIFGVDVNGWKPGETVTVDEDAIGHPLHSLRDLPPATYNIQAVLHVYETFHRSDGHTVKLPMDNGEGQHWNRSPGNLFSEPAQAQIDHNTTAAIEMDKTIPPIEPPTDTEYIRHLRIESKLLTEFWGRPIYLGAIVLVPEGFDGDLDAVTPCCSSKDISPAHSAASAPSPLRLMSKAGTGSVGNPDTASIKPGRRDVFPRC